MLWADFVSPSWIAVQPRLYAAIQMLALLSLLQSIMVWHPYYYGGECEEV